MSQEHRPRRPVLFTSAAFEAHEGSMDPAEITQVAHQTAAVLVGEGRATTDPDVRARLVGLVEEIGLSSVAELWAGRPAVSLPGALWRLYALREWVRRDPAGAAADYAEGLPLAQVSHAIAGSAEPPTPDTLSALVDAILGGVFAGDVGVALDRAAAFCRVVSIGRAHRADDTEAHDAAAATRQTSSASALLTTAADLARCATAWRHGSLD